MGWSVRQFAYGIIAFVAFLVATYFLVRAYVSISFSDLCLCMLFFVGSLGLGGISFYMNDISPKQKIKALKYAVSKQRGSKNSFVNKFGEAMYKTLLDKRIIKENITNLDVVFWTVTADGVEESKNYD